MLLIYVLNITPRVEYTMDLVFTNIIGTRWKLTVDKQVFLDHNGPKLNYSPSKIDQEPFIKTNILLFEDYIHPLNPEIKTENGIPLLFPTNTPSLLTFDPFAASFYLTSRYEEYLPYKEDHHGRFTAKQSYAYQHQFLQLPVVNIWCKMLENKLKQIYPELKTANKSYNFKATIDIDNAYAFLEKGWARTIGALGKHLVKFQFKDITNRIKTIITRKNDPYDTYQHLLALENKYNFKHTFFFLLGDYAKFDRNSHFKNKRFRLLISNISQEHEVGIHPSFKSNFVKGTLKKEIQRLEEIISKKNTKSRQHFLMLKFPATYKNLIRRGILEDYSMGFSDQIGFRAGIASPYLFFNLKTNEPTQFLIHPFQVMEATLKNYMHLSPEESIEQISKLITETKKVNGTFTTLWHNETLCNQWNWKGWKDLYEAVIIEALN